ncbi:MAG TPA: hypothetical protein DDW33_08035 [Ktedonobacter sp.]|jgi:hypothetical protein|nr:hypothetical protein [Ktedonobacter sp.]HBE25620.1 hypothetical protein [Ktedonobacter sp.]
MGGKHSSRWRQKTTQFWKAIVRIALNAIDILGPIVGIVFLVALVVVVLKIAYRYDPINNSLRDDPILNIIVSSLFVGLIISFFWWWFLQHLAPKVRFCDYILKWEAEQGETPSGYKYSIQFWNAGIRDIIDVEIVARLKIKGLKQEKPENFFSYMVLLGYDRLPIIVSKKRSEAAFAKNLDAHNHITRLDVRKIAELQEDEYPGYPGFIVGKLRKKKDEISQAEALNGQLKRAKQKVRRTLLEKLILQEKEFLAGLGDSTVGLVNPTEAIHILDRDAHLIGKRCSKGRLRNYDLWL